MAMVRNFHEKLEKDLERVTAEMARRREHTPELPPREAFKQSLAAAVPPPLPADVPAETSVKAEASTKDDDARLPSYLSGESPEVKAEVTRLVTLAFQEGLAPAVAAAAKKSPFMLDALHDALADKLLPELEKRGII